MSRLLNNEFKGNKAVVSLLDRIADRNTPVEEYRNSFLSIGVELGHAAMDILPSKFNKSTMLACASEDADWLAKGFLEGIGEPLLPLAVFWGIRKKLSNGRDINSIVGAYQDKLDSQCTNLIIIKSIISSSCVVKTQLLRLISEIVPENIYIVAPVMYKDAQKNLSAEFPPDISSKFEFITFAIDDEINERGEIIPGIGGMIYPRLGLDNEVEKNRYIPNIVKERLA